MPQKQKVKWYANVRRYRGKDGRFVSERTVVSYVKRTANKFADKLYRDAKQLTASYDPDQFASWATKAKRDIKAMHNAVTAIALGGKKASIRFAGENQVVWDDAQRAAAQQLAYFDRFALGVLSGSIPVDGRVPARAAMYAQAAFQSYQNAVRLREIVAGSYDEERRVLGSHQPCKTCIAQAQLGWQSVGTLRRLGDSECLSRCKCRFEFRKTPKRK